MGGSIFFWIKRKKTKWVTTKVYKTLSAKLHSEDSRYFLVGSYPLQTPKHTVTTLSFSPSPTCNNTQRTHPHTNIHIHVMHVSASITVFSPCSCLALPHDHGMGIHIILDPTLIFFALANVQASNLNRTMLFNHTQCHAWILAFCRIV